MNDYQTYIHKSRYARWNKHTQRRETWEETVNRYTDFFHRRHPDISVGTINTLYNSILNMEVMPSMRCLMTAGEALDRDNVAGYNCSYVAIDDVRAFDEAMYILLCGTGVGFSVERQYINSLPFIQPPDERAAILKEAIDDDNFDDVFNSMDNTNLRRSYDTKEFYGVAKDELSRLVDNHIVVTDSKYGWASSLRILIVELYNRNYDISWDVSKVRPAGERLKIFGGRASGPAPLESLFTFVKEVFVNADGRKLTSIECHDIMCKIGEVVVVGGVRRSACISLSNLTDSRMAKAKSGQWWENNPQRTLANNSVCYTEKPDMGAFIEEWSNLYESKSGERGIFSREASNRQAAKNGRRSVYSDYGTNPCSEIILRSKQFCNLSEVIVRDSDNYEDLRRKVRVAAILGTIQGSLTDFVYLRPEWTENTREETLLGVSLTGIMDHKILSRSGFEWGAPDSAGYINRISLEEILDSLQKEAIATNKKWSERIGINHAAAITCVKPSGTVSQLTDTSSGIHPRHSTYYLRTVRADNKDPVTEFLKNEGVPHEPDVTKPDSTTVFSFPQKAPEGAIIRTDRSAIEQLELWLIYQHHWCEHKPSITVYVKEHEWMGVGAWVYEHFGEVSGISFLPFNEHSYQQAPYQDIDEEEYNRLQTKMPAISWDRLAEYEFEDNTEGSQQLACTGGQCEI